jgi:hypothetical protein
MNARAFARDVQVVYVQGNNDGRRACKESEEEMLG